MLDRKLYGQILAQYTHATSDLAGSVVDYQGLTREPWDASQLDARLDRAIRRWLADPRKGHRFESENNHLVLSRIFDWFEHDFRKQGGIRTLVEHHTPPPFKRSLQERRKNLKLTYFPYDWRLNDTTGRD